VPPLDRKLCLVIQLFVPLADSDADANLNKAYVKLSHATKTIPQKYRIETKRQRGQVVFARTMH